MTPRSPKSPARKKAMPPYWIVFREDGMIYDVCHTDLSARGALQQFPTYRAVKYTPVPPRSRKSKGGRRG